MFAHLVDDEFAPPVVAFDPKKILRVEKADPADIIDAKMNTTEWLEQLGAAPDEIVENAADAETARMAFATVVSNPNPVDSRAVIANVKTPEAVKHLVGLLTAFDWAFVEQAKELRGYAVAKILEETQHPDAKYRLRALELLGKVTEVALFTERVEVKKAQMSDQELEQRIKDKISRFMGVVDVQDAIANDEP